MLIDVVVQNLDNFTPNERKLAQFIIDNPDVIERSVISQLADIAKVSTATIMRLSKKLGYDGYSDFRYAIIRDRRVSKQTDSVNLSNTYLTDFAESLVALESIDEKRIHAIAQSIVRTKHVFCIGFGLSSLPSIKLQFELTRLGYNVTVIDNPILLKDLKINHQVTTLFFSETITNNSLNIMGDAVSNLYPDDTFYITTNFEYENYSDKILLIDQKNIHKSVDVHLLMCILADNIIFNVLKQEIQKSEVE